MTIDAFIKREFYDWISFLDYLIDECNNDDATLLKLNTVRNSLMELCK